MPFLASLPGRLKEGGETDTVFSHTDLYATLAALVGHQLAPEEAQDSHNSLAWWTGEESAPDERPRVFFCHLGPPFSNDTLVMRKGHHKLFVEGGLAMPWIEGGELGAATPRLFYDLEKNPYEDGDDLLSEHRPVAGEMATQLLQIHNQGYSRDLGISSDGDQLIVSEGWHNVRNDVTGEIGFVFTPQSEIRVTELGMWSAPQKSAVARGARDIPDEFGSDRPSAKTKGGALKSSHRVRLITLPGDGDAAEIASTEFTPSDSGKLDGTFRYQGIDGEVTLNEGEQYLLLMTTQAGDGDPFRDPAAFDGLSPLVHPDIRVEYSVLVRGEDFFDLQQIPSFSDMNDDFRRHRLPVGPTLRFAR